MDDTKELLKQILTAEVLLLGKALKIDKAARGVQTTSDCTSDAAQLIKNNQSRILEMLL